MVNKIGRTRNYNDTATTSVVSLNASTATTIANANDVRLYLKISNRSFEMIWIKLQAASVDNDTEGIPLPAKSTEEIPMDNVYTGEVSAIAESGTPDVQVVEY